MTVHWPRITALLFGLCLMSCGPSGMRPEQGINSALQRSAESRRWPSMGNRWLASVTSRNGRERVELVNLRNGQPVPLPGINQADAQPISVSVSADGTRIALVRSRDGRTELMLYRRGVGMLQRLPLEPAGVPREVSLDGSGRLLAVQVSRQGRWDVDLIRLP
ncbi:hypothetical protein MITS9509_02906 [Synechococcus sp. MIT S9509]|nr:MULTISPECIES: hypothetical protein [unclassified Synechococcus]KZR84728.1 hypothetical protein MITS9504_02787 [Synechococcus sp. MIT S9504]KZR89840.1 hypothetical protein MITS9509_02906 [Synechococcus sp. MIT S9509]